MEHDDDPQYGKLTEITMNNHHFDWINQLEMAMYYIYHLVIRYIAVEHGLVEIISVSHEQL